MADGNFEPRIIAFSCNWCAYAGADFAGVSRIQYPPNVKILRVMCSGRVEPSFILRAFEKGADGVIVGGCHEADCHYISGNLRAKERVEATQQILEMLGLGSERLRIKWINANEGEALAREIEELTVKLKQIGPNPLSTGTREDTVAALEFEDILNATDARLCVECGKCTASCPVSRRNPDFSPRLTVEMALENLESEVETSPAIWECLTCGICEERCPYNVRFSDFIKDTRVEARSLGRKGNPVQAGAIFSWMRMMASNGLKQRKLGWLEDGLQIKHEAESDDDIMFFVGCLPYYEVSHRQIMPGSVQIARDSVAILNSMGITPVLLPDERCCGHDMLYSGNPSVFEALAIKTAEAIRKANVKRVVLSCPEGYLTMKHHYPQVLDGWDVEVMHITELLSEGIDSGRLTLNKEISAKITYQDPCRLGRRLGIYQAPRKVLSAIPGIEMVEMNHYGPDAICSGVSSWVNCGNVSRSIQIERLREAKSTGASMLVTSCPKCLIHFRCALSGKTGTDRDEIQIETRDITGLVREALI